MLLCIFLLRRCDHLALAYSVFAHDLRHFARKLGCRARLRLAHVSCHAVQELKWNCCILFLLLYIHIYNFHKKNNNLHFIYYIFSYKIFTSPAKKKYYWIYTSFKIVDFSKEWRTEILLFSSSSISFTFTPLSRPLTNIKQIKMKYLLFFYFYCLLFILFKMKAMFHHLLLYISHHCVIFASYIYYISIDWLQKSFVFFACWPEFHRNDWHQQRRRNIHSLFKSKIIQIFWYIPVPS